jgi:hypothetical protein
VSTDRKQESGLSITTLVIASCSSLVAAAVVSRVWGGGTLVGAAVTPVIVALVSEGLKKPATVISTVRETRTSTGRYDPVAEGRRGLREGDLAMASRTRPAPERERSVHRAGRRAPRRPLILAIVTGLVAFAIAAVVLTSSDLVLGRSVTGTGNRTTLWSGPSRDTQTKDKTQDTTTDKTTPSQTTTTTTPTTTTPTSTTPTTTTTTPTPQDLHSPDTQEPAPSQTQPPSSTQPAPAPTPTTPSAQPPASTTPSNP